MSLKQSFAAILATSSIWAADAPAPVPLDQVVSSISVPPGFRVSLFAGEPDVVQPIAMTTDARGRLWVVECLSYPDWTRERAGSDRVTIFEDTDGDGRFDKRTVFFDRGRNLTGIALGFGGVWLCSTPELIFIPDADGDDRPDGEPQVHLDGWSLESQHNVFNNLNWGPDGWLYGCNGILKTSMVGAPGTPEGKRTAINCGVWRYHPTRKIFEVVSHGTTNPWGIAFDEMGQIFVANCVIKHLFHIVPGARYERMFGQDFNPYSFELIPSIADHIHWAGGYWKTEGAEHPRNDQAGGGHAHSGAMIYLGDMFPKQYRGRFFTVNIHGHRVNQDTLVRSGSGYVAKHAEDFMRVNDTWFRGVSMIPAADGSIYVSDWSDAGECHDYVDIHRDNGRIYRVAYGNSRYPAVDLRRLRDIELVQNLAESNDWVATQSRLILQERGAAVGREARTVLGEVLRQSTETPHRLRVLWAWHALGELTHDRTVRLLRDRDEYIRAWTVQLSLEPSGENKPLIDELVRMAVEEPSPVVRLYLSSALQRIPPADRVRLASGLVRHAQDASDQNIPPLIWFGIESLVAENEVEAVALLTRAEIPQIRRFIAQRLSLAEKLSGLAVFLAEASPAAQADVISGMFTALNGRREFHAPEQWAGVAPRLERHPEEKVRQQATRLSLVFGDARAMANLKAQARDRSLDARVRANALEGLMQTRNPEVRAILRDAIRDEALRGLAIRGLAVYEDAETPGLVLGLYRQLTPEEKAEAINTLSSRASFAGELLGAVKRGDVPARDITPFSARQIHAFGDVKLEGMLKELGSVREVSGEKSEQIARYKALLNSAAMERANLSRGRVVYQRACAACHTLFDEGGTLAPELTGSQRTNLDYILENVVDPNAVVWDRYKAVYFETDDDRLVSGAVLGENESTVTIQTQTGIVTLPRTEIVSRRTSELSMMPEGLFETLDEQEIIDLVAYLQSPEQVPVPPK